MTRRPPPAMCPQGGQALVEALVATFGLGVLWVAIHWLAQYQDIALSTVHASRHAAFLATRSGLDQGPRPSVMVSQVERFFTGESHRWPDRRGDPVIEAASELQLEMGRHTPLRSEAQPGGQQSILEVLREEWGLADRGPVTASVSLNFLSHPRSPQPASGPLGLAQFDLPYEGLMRKTAILHDAGHASSDADTQWRAGASMLAWGRAQAASRAVGQEVADRASGVDDAWARPDPSFDWLFPWAGLVPREYLQSIRSP